MHTVTIRIQTRRVTVTIKYGDQTVVVRPPALTGGRRGDRMHTVTIRIQTRRVRPSWSSSAGGPAIDITYNFVDPTTSKNAGHVNSITNKIDTTRSQTFTYDQLNRITSALTTSTHATSPTHCWGETYQYDSVANGAWGNLTQIAATTNSAYTGCVQESGFSSTADGNNHLSIFGYDLSGNTSSDGVVPNYQWNAESQLKSAAGVTYTYDGDGRRVSKVGTKLYWYGSGGEILAETDALGNTLNEYIFFGGKRVALLPSSSNPQYYVEDLLGTSRVLTTNAGVVCYDADFYPFGGERTPYTSTCTQNNYKFEGEERDTETGNDDFGARYYSNRFGRWLSADWSAVPVPVPYANLANPQTLNLYSMVADDPESFADLDGHCCDGDGIGDTIGRFFATAVATWASDNAGGAFRPTPSTVEGKLGQALGDTIATYTGASEVELGQAGLARSGGMALVPGGQEDAAAAAIGSAALELHGALTVATGQTNLAKSALEENSSSGTSDGRAGKQERLNEIGKDDKASSADRGWIKQDQNAIKNGKRDTVRVPPGKQLAHTRGREAAKGYSHTTSPSKLQNTQNHRTQHKYDANGTKNKERP
jgi:RHS repeat-associated protein